MTNTGPWVVSVTRPTQSVKIVGTKHITTFLSDGKQSPSLIPSAEIWSCDYENKIQEAGANDRSVMYQSISSRGQGIFLCH